MRKLPSCLGAMTGAALCLMLAAPAEATPSVNNLPLGSVTFKLSSATTETNTWMGCAGTGGCENTWGVGTITQINQGFTPLWNTGDSGQYLNFMIYGVSDISASGTGPFQVDSAGATAPHGGDGNIHIDIFLSSTPASFAGGPSGRTGYGTDPGVTTGTAWLKLVLSPGCDPSNPLATLCQTVNSTTAPASGTGEFNATPVGGSAFGNITDVSGIFDVQDASPGKHTNFTVAGMCNFPGATSNCFDEAVSDPVSATVVPEPSSLSIMGACLALMGAATLFRKKRKASALA